MSPAEPINPNSIIELQLKYLHDKASIGPLADTECRSLEALIRCRLLLERVQVPPSDSFPDLDVELMKARLREPLKAPLE